MLTIINSIQGAWDRMESLNLDMEQKNELAQLILKGFFDPAQLTIEYGTKTLERFIYVAFGVHLDAAYTLMQNLDLNPEQRKGLWKILHKFISDSTHLQKEHYPDETLKHLLYVFDIINLSHLSEQSRNNPEIIGQRFRHNNSREDLRHLSKEMIMKLLKSDDSELRTRFYRSQLESCQFLRSYPHEVDIDFFILLMEYNPSLIRFLPTEKTLEFLKNPQLQQFKDTRQVGARSLYSNYPDYEALTAELNTGFGTNLEILLELYQNYNRDILYELSDVSDNGEEAVPLIKQFCAKYPNHVDLKDVISITSFIDQKSLNFSHDPDQQLFSYSGVASNGQTLHGSFKLKTDDVSWEDPLKKLAHCLHLEPELFHKMIATLPVKQRAYYLFEGQGQGKNTVYMNYLKGPTQEESTRNLTFSDRLTQKNRNEAHIQTSKSRKHKSLDILAELIYPSKNMSASELEQTKQQVCASLNNYTSNWKLSIFGHHHEERAQQIIKTINKATSLAQIDVIIENQLYLFENNNVTSVEACKREFLFERIYKNQSMDAALIHRWHMFNPKNTPDLNHLTNSGYYRALQSAKSLITEINVIKQNNPGEEIELSLLQPG